MERYYCPSCGMVGSRHTRSALDIRAGDVVKAHPLFQFKNKNDDMPDDQCPGGKFDRIKDRAP